MNLPPRHRWDVTPQVAIQIQRELASRVSDKDEITRMEYVAGVDVGFEGTNNSIARAAVVVLKFPELVPVASSIARTRVVFPYVPGLLSFRESPVILRALEKLRVVPDLIIVDGQGRAHPRRMGIACHLGVLLGLPTIGCAKSILCGTAKEPANRVGATTRLFDQEEEIGAAVRTRVNVKPVYVSVGHRVSLNRAVEIVLACCKGYRVPETTRYAHRLAGGEEILLQRTR